jgi:hypothetical protein
MDSDSQPLGVVVSAAYLALRQWHRRLGAAGLAEMGRSPWLTALVDQHAAVVRDALAGPDGRVAVTGLAAYADGVSDAAAKRGWHLDEVGDGGWAYASWPTIRLLAVCAVARGAGLLPTAPETDAGR